MKSLLNLKSFKNKRIKKYVIFKTKSTFLRKYSLAILLYPPDVHFMLAGQDVWEHNLMSFLPSRSLYWKSAWQIELIRHTFPFLVEKSLTWVLVRFFHFPVKLPLQTSVSLSAIVRLGQVIFSPSFNFCVLYVKIYINQQNMSIATIST